VIVLILNNLLKFQHNPRKKAIQFGKKILAGDYVSLFLGRMGRPLIYKKKIRTLKYFNGMDEERQEPVLEG
jgi:hypothetical protein